MNNMYRVILILCLISSTLAYKSLDKIFKYPPRLNNRIVGGEAATIEEFPYMISLIYYVIDEDFFMPACGGSLIRPDVVLSAAHCTIFTNASNVEVSVRAGSIYDNEGGQARNVTKIINHDIHPTTLNNDISLAIVSQPFILDGITVALIALPEQGQFIPDGIWADMAGWGRTAEGGERSDYLQRLTLPTLHQDLCKAAYANHIFITDEMVCAGFMGQNGPSPCHGDSGGPLVYDDVLIGIVSFGIGCARPNYPGVFARVPAFREWIDENLENLYI